MIQFETDIERSRGADGDHTLFATLCNKESGPEAVYSASEPNLEILLSSQALFLDSERRLEHHYPEQTSEPPLWLNVV